MPIPPIPPDIQDVLHSALDGREYRTWTDDFGNRLSTAGALIPAGYGRSIDAAFPWICPVRSCRKMLPSLNGLGRHFCNSHRAARLNDNQDGTLTDLGTYADPTTGDGRHSACTTERTSAQVGKQPYHDEAALADQQS
ncbi:hypothetical protein VTG60DRAFT_2144 [Thermothelomyces hinnuleus]